MKRLRFQDRIVRTMFLAVAIASAMTLGVSMLTACNMTLAGGSSSTETGDKVSLSGRVMHGGVEPVSGVVVTLKTTGLSDTTDSDGTYRLTGNVPEGVTVDTLRFTLDGQLINQQTVSDFEKVLPDIQIVQRDFSGALDASDIVVTRIEGVVTGDGIPPGDSISVVFFHNRLVDAYSGFVWFPPSMGTVRTYTVHVNIYGEGGVRIGRSVDVPFNSHAGNITLPAFQANNLVAPVPAKTP